MEGLLSTGPTPSSVFNVIIILPYYGKNPLVPVVFIQDYIMLTKTGVCHLCYHTMEGDHKVNNKGRYWRCLKCNLTTLLRFSTVFYKSKLKLVNFVMMLYCFTEPNKRNTPKKK